MTENKENLAASANPAEEKKKLLLDLLPEAFSEGRLDVAALKRALGEETVLEGNERYAISWAGKNNAYKVLQSPTTATMRPQRDLSINFDEAAHIFIEGENLEVLKVLQKSYFGKVRFIYIDPPYNTGSDSFIYPDRFQETKEEYLRRINDLTDDGTLMREGFFRKNNKENGHFHSNWLSMMLPRLYIARNLLNEDGVVFISCDDNELHNLRCLMNEIFGEENFIAIICWRNVTDNNPTLVNKDNEFILCFAKAKENLPQSWKSHFSESKELLQDQYDSLKAQGMTIEKIQAGIREFISDNIELMGNLTRYKHVDETGVYTGSESVHNPRPGGYDFEILHKETQKPMRKPANGYRFPRDTFLDLDKQELILYGEDENRIIKIKKYLKDYEDTLRSVIRMDGRLGSYDLKRIFETDEKLFDNPKPVDLILQLASYVCDKDSLVLDMFAGSCTTAEAIIRLNKADGGSRKIICVQLPEECPEDTAAFRNGFKTIDEIGRERIRRVIQKTKTDPTLFEQPSANFGFKSFALAPSNFKQWRGDGIESPDQLAEQMALFVKGEKDGAQSEDIFSELLLKFGQELTVPVEKIELAGVSVFAIHQQKMLFVIEGFSEEMIEPLLSLKPREIIAIDSVFHDSDELKTNLDLQCRDAGVKFTCI